MKTILFAALVAALGCGCTTLRPTEVRVRVAYLAPVPVYVDACVHFTPAP